MNELALFAGGGGGLLASRLLGWRTVCAVEIEPKRRGRVLQRQRDGMLDQFPIWDDVRTFDGSPWRGVIDVVSGGFPCQDVSAAGPGEGLAGSRSGLWFDYLRIVAETRPAFVFAENSPLLRTRGLGTILQGLAVLGYDARWGVLGGWHVGAPHKRNRLWLVAYDPIYGRGQGRSRRSDSSDPRQREQALHDAAGIEEGTRWWESEPGVGRVVHGVSDWVDRIKAIGDGQIPAVAATAWRALAGSLLTDQDAERCSA